ncbi:hypothetical protein R0J87_21335, partial [Halomonas sp. SIMBA_159]
MIRLVPFIFPVKRLLLIFGAIANNGAKNEIDSFQGVNRFGVSWKPYLQRVGGFKRVTLSFLRVTSGIFG